MSDLDKVMPPVERCETCRHWMRFSVRQHVDPKLRGHCTKGEMREGGGGPADDESLMWGQDDSDYVASVYTRPEFGCVMWESK